jgi:hypothetical protein
VAQVRKDKYTPSDSKSSLQAGLDATDSTKDRMFRFNPGKTLKLFPPKHPYYKMPQSDKDEVERRAYAEYRKQLRLKARERLQGKEIEMEELGKVGFLNYRLFLTGWDSNFVSSNNTLIP